VQGVQGGAGTGGVAGAQGPVGGAGGTIDVKANATATTHYLAFAAGTGAQEIRIRNATTAVTIVPDSGNISTPGDITAFASDDRLKHKLGNIDKPLERISKLNGFFFKFNEKAAEFGLDSNKQYVGLSAQEMMISLEEAVRPSAVANGQYYTIQYEKTTPLLIEAIKELIAENNTLKNRLDAIELKLFELINRY
jgi:hypothetical protein